MEVLERLKLLEPFGVEWSHDYTYEGEVGAGRHRVELPEKIMSVKLPLTPEEWCRTCMRDGDMYVGPCCGNTGVIQDVINGVFRDNGWIDLQDFFEMGVLARDHDGFETFTIGDDDERFAKALETWAKADDYVKTHENENVGVDTWWKIGTVYAAVEPLVTPRPWERPTNHGDDPVSELVGALRFLEFAGLFTQSDSLKAQHEANVLVQKARALPAAQSLVEKLANEDIKFRGTALVEKGTDTILSNRLGLCIYRDEAEAQKWLDVVDRAHAAEENLLNPPVDPEMEIVPVTVDVQRGAVLERSS